MAEGRVRSTRSAGRSAMGLPLLAIGGLAIVVGPMLTWRVCATPGCVTEGLVLNMGDLLSGFRVGYGLIASLAGLLLIGLAIHSWRRRGRLAFRSHGLVFAGAAATAAIASIAVHPGPDWAPMNRLTIGPTVVIAGSAIASIGVMRLPARRPRRHEVDAAISIAMLCGVVFVWQLELLGMPRLGSDLTPTLQAYAGVLLAVAVGFWPGRLPVSGVTAAMITLLLVAALYVAVAASVIGPELMLLVPAQLGLALGLGIALPASRGDASSEADAPRLALLALASAISLGIVVLVIARLLGFIEPFPLTDLMRGYEVVDWELLAVGLGILAALLLLGYRETAGAGRRHASSDPIRA